MSKDNPLGNTEADGGVKLKMPTFLSWTAIVALLGAAIAGANYITGTRAIADETAADLAVVQAEVKVLQESDRKDSERLVRVEEQLKVGVDLMRRALDKLDRIEEPPRR